MRHDHCRGLLDLPTEILLHIFTIIHEIQGPTRQAWPAWGSVNIYRATIAALASTCRTFKEPALDVLWKDIEGFKPLLLCLPEGLVRKQGKGKLILKRPLFTKEWRIFAQYARRIHSFTITNSGLDAINDDVVQALVAAPSSPLFPSLRKLEWLDGRDSFLPLLRTLLVPTVRSMKLKLTCNEWNEKWGASFAKSALLASLGTHCTSIRELDCVYDTGWERNSDVVSEAVCDCRELVRLKTGVLNAQALAHLASLLSLKSLHFSLPYDHSDPDVPPDSIPTFTFKLDEVRISAPTHDHFAQGFRNIRFLSCRSVVLYIDWDDATQPYYPRDIPDFIVSFSKCFTPTLKQLRVEISPGDDKYDRIFNDRSYAFGFDVIAPLLPFICLTVLDLDWICTSGVDDEGLKNMVQSWPRLKKFSFGTGVRWLVPPSVTFIGLVYLVQHCQDLYSIQMRFSACSIDTDSEPFSSTIPNEKLTTLFVGFSPIVDPMDVACQLHALLPNLTEVTRYDWDEDEFEDPMPPSYVEWKRVDEYLRVLAKGVELREKIGELLEESSLPSSP